MIGDPDELNLGGEVGRGELFELGGVGSPEDRRVEAVFAPRRRRRGMGDAGWMPARPNRIVVSQLASLLAVFHSEIPF